MVYISRDSKWSSSLCRFRCWLMKSIIKSFGATSCQICSTHQLVMINSRPVGIHLTSYLSLYSSYCFSYSFRFSSSIACFYASSSLFSYFFLEPVLFFILFIYVIYFGVGLLIIIVIIIYMYHN